MFNTIRNVTIIPCGLGDKRAELRLSIPIKPSGSVGYGLSHIVSKSANMMPERRANWKYIEETIRISTIDEIVETKKIDRVDFIKADIEGWELRMLTGAKKTLMRDHPSLMIEVADAYLSRAGDSTNELFDYLTGFGYRAFQLDPGLLHFEEITHPEDSDVFFTTSENINFT